ncbi:hypothetical protein D3C75_1011870 [compost metagenome]
MPDPPEAVRPVHHGRFIELRIDPGDGCQIDDRVPADIFPDFRKDNEHQEGMRIPHQHGIASNNPEMNQQLADNACIRIKQRVHEAYDEHP